MTDYKTKLDSQSNVHHTTIHSSHHQDAHEHNIVSTHGNNKLNLKKHQIIETDIHRNYNLWRYNSKSDLSTMISNVGQAHIQIDRGSGSGHVKSCWLRFVIQNSTGGNVLLTDMANLLQEIEFTTPSGTSIQILRGIDEFRKIFKMINTIKYFKKGKIIANKLIKTYYLPLVGCFLEATELFTSCVDGDINCYIRFKPSSSTVISGSAPTLIELSLDCQMEQLDSNKRGGYIQRHKSTIHHFFYPYSRHQSITQTLNASTTYSLNLSSIKGDVVWLDFIIRRSNVGSAVKKYTPIVSFKLLNNEGDELTGQNVITSDFNKSIMQVNYFPGIYSEYANIYSFVFSIEDSAPIHLLMNGQKLGSYPFSTYEKLEFITTVAGVNEVTTIAPSSTPVSGAYKLFWVTLNSIEFTNTLNYNDNAATIKAAIEALSTFDGIITVSGPLTASATFTFGGNYGLLSLQLNGYYLGAQSLVAVNGSAATVNWDYTVTTPGVDGLDNGQSHSIDIFAYTTSFFSIKLNSQVDVRHT